MRHIRTKTRSRHALPTRAIRLVEFLQDHFEIGSENRATETAAAQVRLLPKKSTLRMTHNWKIVRLLATKIHANLPYHLHLVHDALASKEFVSERDQISVSPCAQCSTSVLFRKMRTEIGSGNHLLNIARNVLAIGDIMQVQGLRCTAHGVHLHLIGHICVSDDCLSFQHVDKFRPRAILSLKCQPPKPNRTRYGCHSATPPIASLDCSKPLRTWSSIPAHFPAVQPQSEGPADLRYLHQRIQPCSSTAIWSRNRANVLGLPCSLKCWKLKTKMTSHVVKHMYITRSRLTEKHGSKKK